MMVRRLLTRFMANKPPSFHLHYWFDLAYLITCGSLPLIVVCINSIIQSFEAITTNLVDQQNFTNLTVIEGNVTMEAIRVNII